MSDTQPLYRAAQVAGFDRSAIDEHGIAGYALMQRAAQAAWSALRRRWPDARRILVYAGGGNNGGDGIELARLARVEGLEARVVLLVAADRLRGEAAQALAAWRAAGGDIEAAAPEGGADPVEADLVVDALLGTGLSKAVGGAFADAIARINASGLPVFAIDIPSGLSADSGAVLGTAVRADLTISFIGRKLGLYTGQGPELAGERLFDDLAVPAAVYAPVAPAAELICTGYAARHLPPRPRSSYKNRHGHVLCVGGEQGMSGAVRLCAEGALRSGAGLVSVATRTAHAALISQQRPELMARGAENPLDLETMLGRASVVAAGPGLGQGPWAQLLMPVLLRGGHTVVLDADALNWLAAQGGPQALPARGERILTPHPGEAARLLGCTRDAVEADRPAAVRALAQRYGAVVVLKGAGSLVCGPEGPLRVCAAGNPGMAAGGMGDVLCGVIAGLCAQGLAAADAAAVGVDVHARAGDRAAADGGERGLLPSDLLSALRPLVNP